MNGVKRIIIIILVTVAARIIFLWPLIGDVNKSIHNDSLTYESIALNLIEGNGYSHCSKAPFHKDVIRTPVYPVLLAGIYKLFGLNRLFVVLFQCFLTFGTAVIGYKIASKYFDENVGFLTGLLIGLDGHLIAYNSQIITESLFSFLLLGTLFLVLQRTTKAIIALGPMAVILILTRPIALWLIPILIFYLIRKKVRLKPVFLSVSLGILLMVPWINHYKKATGHLGISSISSYNVYLTFANAFLAHQNNQQEDLHRENLIKSLDHPIYGDCENDYRYINELNKKGKEVLIPDIFSYTMFHIRRSINGLLPEVTTILELWEISEGGKGTLSVLNQEGIIKGVQHYFEGLDKGVFLIAWFTLLWGVSLICSIIGLVKAKGDFRIILVFIILYFLIIPGPASTPRFFTPVAPLVCILAAVGMHHLFGRFFSRKIA